MKQRLKAAVRKWLERHAPGLHAGALHVLHANDPSRRLSTEWHPPATEVVGSTPLPSALVAPGAHVLEQPDDLDALCARLGVEGEEVFEPVVELGQMRLSPAPLCFVVVAAAHDSLAIEQTLQSVLRQTDPDWEVLLCTTDADADTLAPWLDIDWRVRRYLRPAPAGEIAFLLEAVRQATTPFVGLLTPGDVVDDDLVKSLGRQMAARPDADLVYSDEARRLPDDRIGVPFFKPDWSPEHQQSVHMIGRFLAIRKALLLSEPPPLSTVPEAAEYELALSLSRKARHIAHLDDPLYIRAGRNEAPSVGGFFPASALAQARTALERHVRAEDEGARAMQAAIPGALHVQWPLAPSVPVTLVILTGMRRKELPGRGIVTLATHFVKSILQKSTATDYRILLVDDGEVEEELASLLAAHGHRTQSCPRQERFSFAYKANFATSLVETGIVILLNDDLEVISPDWIQALAAQAARPQVGAVGGRLLFADGTLQHAGIGVGFGDGTGHIFHTLPADGHEYAGLASIERNYSAVTGAVMAYRKDVFEQLKGFDLRFGTDYNDVDFCLRCIALGYRVVYSPAATLYHFHNASLNRVGDSGQEREAFQQRWQAVIQRDPYLNKHFQLKSVDLALVETA